MARMTVGKILYGAAFTVVLPVLLILWAAGAEPSVALPAFGDPAFGFVLALCGLGLTAAGMRGLWRFGGGLPMNAFPPPKLVSRGAFRWIPHPIYTGFVAACLGVSMAARSAAGLWLVTPVVALGCAALVLGYERPDMLRRFGAILRVLPADEEKPPAATDRARFFFAAVVPWIAFYEYAAHLAPGSPWAGAVYWSLWLAAAASTWFARTRRGLRRLMVSVWVAAAVTLPFCWLARAPFPPLWAAAAALVAAPALLRPEFFWERLRRAAERLANSWREWRIGPVRIINHGLYAGAGAFVHVAVVIAAVGPERKWDALATAFAGLIGAGIWAQWVEGSSRLRRPFGFYGGLIGAGIACLFFEERWILLAGHCLGAPWLQAIGRLRCLVNGCCHGAPAPDGVGIRVTHPRSRVTRLANLTGVPIHATQLYSILGNVALGGLLARLWLSGSPLPLVCGVYAIGNGCARFVEEAYRGEPQTKVVGGLRLYQWIAAGSVAAGAALTAFRASPAPPLMLSPAGIVWAAAFGLLAGAALGVDFPETDRPFARLT